MLNFEDDAAPAARMGAGRMSAMPGLQSSGLSSFMPSMAATPLMGTPHVAFEASRAPVAAVERRVNAADKRIINGSTDVNQLVPFKYK